MGATIWIIGGALLLWSKQISANFLQSPAPASVPHFSRISPNFMRRDGKPGDASSSMNNGNNAQQIVPILTGPQSPPHYQYPAYQENERNNMILDFLYDHYEHVPHYGGGGGVPPPDFGWMKPPPSTTTMEPEPEEPEDPCPHPHPQPQPHPHPQPTPPLPPKPTHKPKPPHHGHKPHKPKKRPGKEADGDTEEENSDEDDDDDRDQNQETERPPLSSYFPFQLWRPGQGGGFGNLGTIRETWNSFLDRLKITGNGGGNNGGNNNDGMISNGVNTNSNGGDTNPNYPPIRVVGNRYPSFNFFNPIRGSSGSNSGNNGGSNYNYNPIRGPSSSNNGNRGPTRNQGNGGNWVPDKTKGQFQLEQLPGWDTPPLKNPSRPNRDYYNNYWARPYGN